MKKPLEVLIRLFVPPPKPTPTNPPVLYRGKTFVIENVFDAAIIAKTWARNPYPLDKRLLAAVKILSEDALKTTTKAQAVGFETLDDCCCLTLQVPLGFPITIGEEFEINRAQK